MQGLANARRDVADERGRLVAMARASAAPAENVLASARDIALAFSHLSAVRNGTAECDADLASALKGVPFLNIARTDAHGIVTCAATRDSLAVSIANLAVWRNIAARQDFVVASVPPNKLASGPAILGLLPFHDEGNRFRGTIDVAIDAHSLDGVLKSGTLPKGSVVALFGANHDLIATTNGAVSRALFASVKMGKRPGASALHDIAGKNWTYATAPLLNATAYVGFAIPKTRFLEASYAAAAFDFVLPFVMIVLSWAAIWIVTDRQVLRWIIYLRRISAAYRGGHYALRPSLDGAPTELKGLGDALAGMAASIAERDRSLREAIQQKNILIKEIHHRVKNNLQVVMSLLSLQARRLKDRAAQDALADTRARINALALVHRILYEIDDQSTVDVKSLLEQLARQTGEGFAAESRHLRVITDVLPRELPSETAVTLSLFTVEAMTNAFKHAFPENRAGTIRVTLEKADGEALRLAVQDDGVGFDFAEDPSSIGGRLIKTFGQQMGGTAVTRSHSGAGSTVEIVFPDPERKAASSAA